LARRKARVVLDPGEPVMGDKGSKDKGKRELQKKAKHTAKEKRRLKREKKAGKRSPLSGEI
jgi:hypothetical protein